MTLDPLVTHDWLAANLGTVDILDATYFLPPDPARVKQEFGQSRLPDAQLFAIDEVADRSGDLAHMMPDAATFGSAMEALGIDGRRPVIVYDRSEQHFSAPRVWYTLRAFGLTDVRVLDGGLTGWREAGHDLASGPADPPRPVPVRDWTLDPDRIIDAHALARLIAMGGTSVLDARPAARFAGTAPEPRPGLRSGHMPGATNLPFASLTRDNRFLSVAELAKVIHLPSPDTVPVVTCGSGMTAATLALGLARLGIDARLYDGSWAEWGRADGGPVVTGDA